MKKSDKSRKILSFDYYHDSCGCVIFLFVMCLGLLLALLVKLCIFLSGGAVLNLSVSVFCNEVIWEFLNLPQTPTRPIGLDTVETSVGSKLDDG